ncbi:MAG: hypothetical protein SPK79_07300 [Erysipelotrichaceae bacterium]|nr:hypothetical protein [Erysipelotrichaceae bacterium]
MVFSIVSVFTSFYATALTMLSSSYCALGYAVNDYYGCWQL